MNVTSDEQALTSSDQKAFEATPQTVDGSELIRLRPASARQVVERKTRSTSFHCIPACASSVVELWFAVADIPKRAVGPGVVTKATKV